MKVIRFKAIDLNTKNEIKEVYDSHLLTLAYLETAKAILDSSRSEEIRMADLIDLTNSFKGNIKKESLLKIEREISDLKHINGDYSKTVLFD